MILAGASPANAQSTGAPAVERKNLLGWAEGVFTIRTPSPPRTEAHVVALDGRPATTTIGVPRHAPLPHEFVVELPAPTTFTSFAVPEIGEFGPAKGRHVKTVEIAGSTESAEAGFTPLAGKMKSMDPMKRGISFAAQGARLAKIQQEMSPELLRIASNPALAKHLGDSLKLPRMN